MKKKRFNIIYNNNEKIGYGKGYYIIYENYENKPTFDTMYKSWEHNEQVDAISVGILNKIRYLYDIGYVLDVYYAKDIKLEDIF